MIDHPDPDRDMADRFYGADASLTSSLKPALADHLHALGDATGMTAAEKDATVTELGRAFHDARFGAPVAARVGALILDHSRTPPDDETRQAWYTESNRLLREQYGKDGPRRLETAREFIAARPAFARMLSESGVGDHPALITALAEQVNALRVTPPKRVPVDGSR